MKKSFISLALALALLMCAAPGAYASYLPPLETLPASSEPLVYTSANISCQVGDTAVISVNAQSPDGGILSYQWYRSIDGTNINGSMIVTATGSNYYADTSTRGTYYYYCVVTNSSAYGSSSVISSTISVTVEESSEPVVEGIGVLIMPDKISYKVGDRLVTDGLTVRVYTDQGYYDVTSGLECSPATLSTEGSQIITVRYAGKSCTFSVDVEEEKEVVQSISVASMPTKTSYTVGERLDTSGLVIRVVTNKQVKDISEGFSCTPKLLSNEGSQQVRVVYGAVSCIFNVSVVANSTPSPSPTATASPSPTASPQVSPGASPEGGAASPSPSSNSSSHEPHETRAGNTFIQVMLALALLALVGLGAYVYTMQRKNRK